MKLGAISFINTLPLYTGLNAMPVHYAPPSGLNRAILAGELDISPVSSVVYLRHQSELVLLKDLSVSSYGAVTSVLWVGQWEPPNPIPVPDDSETSIALLAWLLKEQRGVDARPYFQSYPAGEFWDTYQRHGNALVIGDHALRFYYDHPDTPMLDLSSAWAAQTGLPFVFAVWVARKAWAEQYPDLLTDVNLALIDSRNRFFAYPDLFAEGVRRAQTHCKITAEQITAYFTQALDYRLTPQHLQALEIFQQTDLLCDWTHPQYSR
jgi:chorismate dehydratase